MKRILAGLVLALTLTAALPAIGPELAGATADHTEHATTVEHATSAAHVVDNYASWYCAKHRTNGYFTITHATWYYLDSQTAHLYCREAFFSVQNQYWVYVDVPLSGGVSWVPWERQECKPTGPFPCDEP